MTKRLKFTSPFFPVISGDTWKSKVEPLAVSKAPWRSLVGLIGSLPRGGVTNQGHGALPEGTEITCGLVTCFQQKKLLLLTSWFLVNHDWLKWIPVALIRNKIKKNIQKQTLILAYNGISLPTWCSCLSFFSCKPMHVNGFSWNLSLLIIVKCHVP